MEATFLIKSQKFLSFWIIFDATQKNVKQSFQLFFLHFISGWYWIQIFNQFEGKKTRKTNCKCRLEICEVNWEKKNNQINFDAFPDTLLWNGSINLKCLSLETNIHQKKILPKLELQGKMLARICLWKYRKSDESSEFKVRLAIEWKQKA